MTDYSYIDKAVADVRQRIAVASKKRPGAHPLPELIAAVKYADDGEFLHLIRECGITQVGENRVQQFTSHRALLSDNELKNVSFHFIGNLQTNKVKYLIGKVALIHSLDSERLAAEIEKQSEAAGVITKVLVEINSGYEESKGGVLPHEAEKFCLSLKRFSHIDHVGFMTMALKCENNEDFLKYFSETYQLVLDIWHEKLHNIGEPIISMGMSNSFETAIESGATCVRVGRALFEK